MALRTATELRNYVYSNVKPNANNEITAQIEQNLFLDFIDSFVISSGANLGVVDASQTSVNITPIGSDLQIPLIAAPKFGAVVVLNGETFDIGETDAAKFYFKDNGNTVVKVKGNLVSGDILHYNSSALGYTLDNLDSILITYLIE